MKFRLPCALFLAAALSASPALARAKLKPVVAAPVVQLSAVVDPDPSHGSENVLVLDLSNGGRVLIRLMPAWAPAHVERVKTLAAQGFYNGLKFHRVIDGFMAQTGDPTGTGGGGSPLPNLKAEFNYMPHVRGAVSMARTDEPDTANSQFFIVFYPRFALDHHYTNFGRVIAGMDMVDVIERGEPPSNPTRIAQASLYSEHKPAPPPAPVIAPPALEPAPAPLAVAAPVAAPVRKTKKH